MPVYSAHWVSAPSARHRRGHPAPPAYVRTNLAFSPYSYAYFCSHSVPCRHRLAIRQVLQANGANLDCLSAADFAEQWHVASTTAQHDARLRLFHFVAAADRADRAGPSQALTREERTHFMVQEARATAAACAGSEALTQKFRALMKGLFDQAIGEEGGGAHVVANPVTKRARKAAAAAAAIATAAGEVRRAGAGAGRGRRERRWRQW